MRDAFKTEDWWAVWIGLFVFALSLVTLAGVDLLGWGIDTRVWTGVATVSEGLAPVARAEAYAKLPAGTFSPYRAMPGTVSLVLTYVFLLAVLSVGAVAMGLDLRRFAAGFTVIFWASYLCWLVGSNVYIAATPNKRPEGVSWSLGLTGEAGYIVALLAGLIVGNFFPAVTAWLKEATRPEWYIKTAIVILGGSLGVQAMGDPRLTQAILFRGFAAIIEAYLIYWALVYFIARRYFRFSREWAAPLASGISICGVSAAIATGAAIRARPVVPIMVSSLVVVFSVVELLVLPFLAQAVLPNDPMVAAAWMGLAVKTDGAAVASGAITQGLFKGQAEGQWMLMTTTTVKVFIDVFIGVWAFVLALVWVYGINKKQGERVPVRDIWQRFPKFVIGYFLTFLVLLGLALLFRGSADRVGALKAATAGSNVFRVLFFVMTFFTIGLVSNFKRLWQEGIGRLALVYVISLFGFIIWIGLGISWIFFHGMRPS
ncbi:MAG TPA: putative sulfate exporter family transporter [Gemmataceae bacterium]|jgi:uncharacterized membrane protein YadS|nr:putative sulfate exporter family transporter [Gemmataceae bacterium]